MSKCQQLNFGGGEVVSECSAGEPYLCLKKKGGEKGKTVYYLKYS